MSEIQETHGQSTTERRRFSRASVLWEAAILDGNRTDGCVMLNVSEGGALLRVLDPFACPTMLNLDVARVGRLNAQVAWRGAEGVGVVFKGDPKDIAARFKQAALPIFAS